MLKAAASMLLIAVTGMPGKENIPKNPDAHWRLNSTTTSRTVPAGRQMGYLRPAPPRSERTPQIVGSDGAQRRGRQRLEILRDQIQAARPIFAISTRGYQMVGKLPG